MGNDNEVAPEGAGGSRPPRRTSRSETPMKAGGSSPANTSDSKELMARSRSLFLRDVERQLARKELYNLDEEFAKTRHNRSPVVWLSVLIFVSVMVVIAVAVTSAIQTRSQKVPVNITAFEDVNLRDILDRAKQLDFQMQTARTALANLQSSEERQLQDARNNAEQQIQVVDAEILTPEQKKKQEAAIRDQLGAQLYRIRAGFASQLEDAKKKIADIQKQLDRYDARQIEAAKKNEAVLNNQQRIFDIQMQNTVNTYQSHIQQLTQQFTSQIESIKQNDAELVAALKRSHATEISNLIATYNPTFTSPEITSILNRPIAPADSTPDAYSSVALHEGVVGQTGLSDLGLRIRDFGLLLGRLREIPYKNSIPSALDHLESLSREVAGNYQSIANGLAARVIADNDLIDSYNNALNSLIQNSRENGYIIDPRDSSRMVVFIAPIYKVQEGEAAFVFRKDDEPIGTIRLQVGPNGVTGRLVSLVKPTEPMEPFDKILLDVKH